MYKKNKLILWAAILCILLSIGFIWIINWLFSLLMSISISIAILIITKRSKDIYGKERVMAFIAMALSIAFIIASLFQSLVHLRRQNDWAKTVINCNLREAYQNYYEREGEYPKSIDNLADTDCPTNTIVSDYIAEGSLSLKGTYYYECNRLGEDDFLCSAIPARCDNLLGLGRKIIKTNKAGDVWQEKCK